MDDVDSQKRVCALTPAELAILIMIQAILTATFYPSLRFLPDSVGKGFLFLLAFLPYTLNPSNRYFLTGTRFVYLVYVSLVFFDAFALLHYTGNLAEVRRQMIAVSPVLVGGLMLFRKRDFE